MTVLVSLRCAAHFHVVLHLYEQSNTSKHLNLNEFIHSHTHTNFSKQTHTLTHTQTHTPCLTASALCLTTSWICHRRTVYFTILRVPGSALIQPGPIISSSSSVSSYGAQTVDSSVKHSSPSCCLITGGFSRQVRRSGTMMSCQRATRRR